MPASQRLHARCSAACARGPFVLSGTTRKYERARPFLIRHLAVDLGISLEERGVEGTATLTFERVDAKAKELVLDAVGFDIEMVELLAGRSTRRARTTYDGDRLSIEVPALVSNGRVRVRYRAKPRRGLYFLAPDASVPARPVQAWSQCQDEDARHFIPCHDKPHVKATIEMTLRVPQGFFALSNGEKVGEERPRGRRASWAYRYRMDQPIPSYLITVVVGRFDRVEGKPARRKGGAAVPVTFFVPEGRASDATRTFGRTTHMLELFGELTGVPFPWSRYSQVVVSDFVFGGMENATATTLYEHVLLDERAAVDITSDDLIAHELAHHWFGDYVTCRDWSHGWLNEGFATFCEHVERESRLGLDEYENGVAGDVQAYTSEAGGRYQRPIVCRDYDVPIELFDRHLYEKGGLVLHMLRRELSDAVFWKGVRLYLERHAHGIVETTDLQRALEEVSGRALEAFFDQWVYSPGHPVLEVRIGWESSQLVVHVRQKQRSDGVPVFTLPLEIAIGDASGSVTYREKTMTEREDTLVVPLAKRPAWVAYDPRFRVVGDVTVKAPVDFLEHQLVSGTTARIRWMATEALALRDDPRSLRALARALGLEREAWMVRAEAARALGQLGGSDALAALLGQVKTKHPKVRRAVVTAIGRFRTPEAARALGPLARRDPSYLVEADACRSLGRTRDPSAKDLLLGAMADPSWAEVKRSGALDGLASLRDETTLDAVIAATRYGEPARARRTAISALARLGEGRKTRLHLEELLDDPDPHLRMSVASALVAFGDSKARGALQRRINRERDGRVSRSLREAMNQLGDGGRAETRAVKDEVEQLRRELGELKLRVGKNEAAGKRKAEARRKGPS